jgi:hypothetical protein
MGKEGRGPNVESVSKEFLFISHCDLPIRIHPRPMSSITHNSLAADLRDFLQDTAILAPGPARQGTLHPTCSSNTDSAECWRRSGHGMVMSPAHHHTIHPKFTRSLPNPMIFAGMVESHAGYGSVSPGRRPAKPGAETTTLLGEQEQPVG